MKKKLLPFIALVGFTVLTSSLYAQDSVKVDPSLKGQYNLVLSKSKSLQGYKMVNPNRLATFWKNVNDTLRTERAELLNSRAKIAAQQKEIIQLQTQIDGKETALASSNNKLNEIVFLGIPFAKSTYNTIVWTLIIVMVLALAIAVFRSTKLLHEAKYRTGLYNEIATEYQNYKVKANEKRRKSWPGNSKQSATGSKSTVVPAEDKAY